MKRWRCSQSNYSELQGRRALAEAQRFVYKQLTLVASVMDVEMPARYFFSEAVDCYHDFDGECEDCGLIVPEWSLLQCQYGFCGKFFCQNCGFRCRRCGDYESRAVSLCSSHARLIYPSCDGCKNQFCDVCTDISVTQVSRKNVFKYSDVADYGIINLYNVLRFSCTSLSLVTNYNTGFLVVRTLKQRSFALPPVTLNFYFVKGLAVPENHTF